jgi:hypothetical protein
LKIKIKQEESSVWLESGIPLTSWREPARSVNGQLTIRHGQYLEGCWDRAAAIG